MALWVDKYRPRDLSALTYHVKQAKDLIEIVKTGDFPHLLVYGPSGAGKMTRIFCILRELYGSGVEKLRMDARSFQAPSGKKLEIQTFSSNYHVQLSPGEVGIYDRVVVQEIIKQMAQMHQIDASTQRNFKGNGKFSINQQDKLFSYYKRESVLLNSKVAIIVTSVLDKYDIFATQVDDKK
ncbi:unnamed protein product [Onchocerca flexuosa]|uniref:Replication factor C small subunit n=1 Tax=Onchocerca flexuosa TaxID=387005 RepID=A0A183HGI4_9BILA|nr:unnamed protein product [Onchocerca flexuosa]